jgi:hypothetical protein
MTQRRVLREPSHHATLLTDYLQTVIADDEADCQPGDERAETHCDSDVSIFRTRSLPSRIHLLLIVPPSFWAAFFLG